MTRERLYELRLSLRSLVDRLQSCHPMPLPMQLRDLRPILEAVEEIVRDFENPIALEDIN